MPKPLVIVESPAKAKTLSRFLGDRYHVVASVGHIRDLPGSASETPAEIKDRPWGRMAVDVDGDFKPYYVVPADKKKHVAALKAALKDASEVLLATDPDREGESISWHLTEVLKPKVPVRRVEFHEVTEDAVNEAISHARTVNDSLVKAQESRRILDRLYGYTLSPVLWKKVKTGLSAGRVQSVAVRLLVEREEARRAFRTATYWDLEARLSGDGREFPADARPAAATSAWPPVRISTRPPAALEVGRRAAPDGSGRGGPRRGRAAQHPLDRHRRRCPSGHRAAGAAVHDLDADPGGEPQARILDEPHDADRAAPLPGRGDRSRRDGRPHHLSPHGLHDAQREGVDRIGAGHHGDVRARVLRRSAPVRDQGEECAGSARGDPADRLPPRAPAARGHSRFATTSASTS